MTDITPLVGFILTFLSAILTAYVVPWAREKLKIAKEQYDQLLDQDLKHWISVAVMAAEQIFSGKTELDDNGELRKWGKEKKEYVVNWLRSLGYELDMDVIDAQIEAVVYELTPSSTFSKPIVDSETW